VTATGPALVGREAELTALGAFLEDRNALPGGAIIEGAAGAGKTTIWRAAVERGAELGYLVLSCRPAGAEVQLSLAALSDLLEPQLEATLPALPAPQRRALEVALLLEDDEGRAPDRRALAAGVLSAIRTLARERPVLLAVDDAQWVDAPSAEVLEFAFRRLRDVQIAILASWRTGSATSPAREAQRAGGQAGTQAGAPARGLRIERSLERPPLRVEAGPMTLGALHHLLRTRTSLEFNRRTLQRIHETSGGNPFYALELARTLEREPAASGGTTRSAGAGAAAGAGVAGGAGEPLPLSSGLNELLADRLTGFDPMTRTALLIAAVAPGATVELVEAAIGRPAAPVLEPAVRGSVIRIDGGTIDFVHPLLAAAAYSASSTDERDRWHARIAEAATDPETRARHLAFARRGPDPEVAASLAEAARSARDRGATAAAADLFSQALARLPISGVGAGAGAGAEVRIAVNGSAVEGAVERATLVAEAAPILLATGEADRARRLLETSIAELPAGPVRGDLLLLLAPLVEGDEAGGQARLRLIQQALTEAGDEPRRTAAALLDLEQWERHRDRSPDALPIARRALALAEESGDEKLLAAAHVRTADLEVVLGLGGEPVARFGRALELGDRVHVDAEHSAGSMLAVCLIRAGRLDEARPYLLAERARAIAEGDEASHSWECLFLAELEWFAGRWDEAAAAAAEGLEVAQQTGLRLREGTLLSLVALVEGSQGDPERARSQAQRAISILDEVDEVSYANNARQILAFIDLTRGDAAAAHEQLGSYAPDRLEGSKRLAFIGDEIEALVQLGDLGRAAELADELGRRGAELNRPTLLATAARCRALVLGSRGELDEAIQAAREAVAVHGELRLPFEHARSLLVLGGVQRRAKQRKDARESLTTAIEVFERLGASRWAERAAAERARVGGRTTIEGLSETELRVAQLVAAGKSNKEVAAELYVSVRAVESNLSKVYAKLGIRSRTELARRI
jgi:DNA-binding NarL/FixJ family response regulator